MQDKELIKKYFYSSNYIVLCLMYLEEYLDYNQISEKNLKRYSPGHLGSSLTINFILSNLNYFLNKNNLTSQLIIGTGHSGASLITNFWLNGTLQKYYPKYTLSKNGLNNLIKDFGTIIRSEINSQYPETIYDGGELGYSLGVAYGYALNGNADIVPCIIGDGEAETGTLSSSWQLNKLLNSKSKVLPIINLNELKMGSSSYLSKLSDFELSQYFNLLGYQVEIVNAKINDNIDDTIEEMQNKLYKISLYEKPLLIFRSSKGFSLPIVNGTNFETLHSVHKNPLQGYSLADKLYVIKKFLQKYTNDIFDSNGELKSMYSKFSFSFPQKIKKEIIPFEFDCLNDNNIAKLESYLIAFLKKNESIIFSPDELYSNMFGRISNNTIEILNENLLQALYQGYTQAGNNGIYISYEGFMPIITSMIAQYYKYLQQKSSLTMTQSNFSLNYILTSTCWENTYSHQNPEFVNSLLIKDDNFYSVLYPKDGNNLLKCVDYALRIKDKINVITTSKRHSIEYQSYEESNISIEILKDCDNPELILCATGDYMLDLVYEVYEELKFKYSNIKIVYVTNPKLLDKHSKNGLSTNDFKYYFNENTQIIYLFSGYPNIIKSLIYDRDINCEILGYRDQIAVNGNLKNNLQKNCLSKNDIISLCESKINHQKVKILRR